MTLLFLTKYDTLGASSRYRFFQFYDFYIENDIKITTKPFFNNKYLLDLYEGKKHLTTIIKAYHKRFFILFSLNKYDLIIIEKELFPYFPALFEKILNVTGIKYIVDYDDALFHQYDNTNNKLVKILFSNKIANVMRYSELVVVGNQYLANYAKNIAHVKNIEIIPTVIDLTRYKSKSTEVKLNDTVIIGWIGSPSTSKYLSFLENVFIRLSQKYNFQVNLIGAFLSPFQNFKANLIQWSEANEVQEIEKFDIGIMPLADSPWERGKCGFKLIQYMGCSLPVIGSPVGVNSEIIDHGINGFLASAEEEWLKAFETLIEDRLIRKTLGIQGRKKVELQYSKQVIESKLLSQYKEIINRGNL